MTPAPPKTTHDPRSLVFRALLSEQRIVFASASLATLSRCIFSCMSALAPFAWHHVFVPVLPQASTRVPARTLANPIARRPNIGESHSETPEH